LTTGTAWRSFAGCVVRGYTHAQHRPGTLWFHRARSEGQPEQHRHLTEPGSSLWRERLAFRDALRADPLVARRYQELEERLAAESGDIAAYTADKREFVVEVLARARVIAEQWAAGGKALRSAITSAQASGRDREMASTSAGEGVDKLVSGY
jgi:GrpB protein